MVFLADLLLGVLGFHPRRQCAVLVPHRFRVVNVHLLCVLVDDFDVLALVGLVVQLVLYFFVFFFLFSHNGLVLFRGKQSWRSLHSPFSAARVSCTQPLPRLSWWARCRQRRWVPKSSLTSKALSSHFALFWCDPSAPCAYAICSIVPFCCVVFNWFFPTSKLIFSNLKIQRSRAPKKGKHSCLKTHAERTFCWQFGVDRARLVSIHAWEFTTDETHLENARIFSRAIRSKRYGEMHSGTGRLETGDLCEFFLAFNWDRVEFAQSTELTTRRMT